MQKIIENVLAKMQGKIDGEQLKELEGVLRQEMIEQKEKNDHDNKKLLEEFLSSKSYEDCSKGTLEMYRTENKKFLNWLQKSVIDVTKKDIEKYLADYREKRNVSNVTLNNMRRYISAFFTYLEYEDIIPCNPVRKTKPVKEAKIMKKPFTELEIEKLRENAQSVRDKAIIDTLNTTGMRVSELCSLNIDDICDRKAVIKGKGNKERIVYFSEKAWYSVEKYISSRTDSNPALFVNERKTEACIKRITKESVESRLRKLGAENSIVAHPHKFRRTVASRAANKGMPIQEIQVLLGHSKIDTTMIYCSVNEANIKLSHERFVG